MKIAVLSGKGGTGKTFVSVNLVSCAKNSVYADCDVEEPNGYIFLKARNIKESPVTRFIPEFDAHKCIKCKKCVEFCRFNALALVGDKPKVFREVCHSCGGCKIVCPTGAISEIKSEIGEISIGKYEDITVITGRMNPGESSGVPIIREVLDNCPNEGLTIIDCPPGSACTVMESIQDADYCLFVTEPTLFGLHNFKMVLELVTIFKKPYGVLINKCDTEYNPIDEFCSENNIPVLSHITYNKKLAQISANGIIASEVNREIRRVFIDLLADIKNRAITEKSHI